MHFNYSSKSTYSENFKKTRWFILVERVNIPIADVLETPKYEKSACTASDVQTLNMWAVALDVLLF